MANIGLMVCGMSSLIASVGTGIYFAREEKRIEEIEKQIEDTSKFIAYTECDYKSDPLEMGKEGEEGIFNVKQPSIKGLIIPAGFTVDTYSREDKQGVKLTYKGPSKQSCLNIHSLEWRKE
jgi:short-subunit dehydrogenase